MDIGSLTSMSKHIPLGYGNTDDILVLVVAIEKDRACSNVIIEYLIKNITTATPNPKN